MADTNPNITPSWGKAKNQCKKFRDEIRSYEIPEDQKIISFMFTKQDLDKLLAQAGSEPAGIRAYFGFKDVRNKKLPQLYVVGCIKKGERYIDIVPSEYPVRTGSSNGDDPLIYEGRPCPSDCGSDNLLNS